MKKCIKTLIALITMIFCFSIVAYAAENDHRIGENNDETLTIFDGSIAPLYEITCPSGKHNMKSNRVGVAANSSGQTVFRGYCYQCSNCYLVLCSERDPRTTHTLGRYCFYMAYEPVGTAGCVVNNASIQSFTGDLRTDSFWQGFQFSKGV